MLLLHRNIYKTFITLVTEMGEGLVVEDVNFFVKIAFSDYIGKTKKINTTVSNGKEDYMQRVENVYKVDDESSGFFLFSEKELMIEYITKYICNMTEVLRGNASKFKMYDFFQTVYLCCEKTIKEIIQSAEKLNKKAERLRSPQQTKQKNI